MYRGWPRRDTDGICRVSCTAVCSDPAGPTTSCRHVRHPAEQRRPAARYLGRRGAAYPDSRRLTRRSSDRRRSISTD
ncbi:hypothetical protein J6590_021101 [Homalodisca vitripennis]|nr:hypothetical protein J6590_021101 [Homalodisca vitripennis]